MDHPNLSRRKVVTMLASALPIAMLLDSAVFAKTQEPSTSSLSTLQAALTVHADQNGDATAAMQALVNAATAAGVSASIPDGDYLIDPDAGVILATGTRLILGPRTRLIATPSRKGSYSVLKVYDAHNVSISGGSIVGERYHHLGHVGEWGMGVDIRGSDNVTVSNTTVSNCWGDGFYIGTGIKNKQPCQNITLDHVTATENRRQGLSIVACNGAKILSSTFQKTSGTSPASGIDIEPDHPSTPVQNVIISDCRLFDNAGAGIDTRNYTDNITIENCTISGNTQGGIRVLGNSKAVRITGNIISNTRGASISVSKSASGYQLHSNTLHPSLMGSGLRIEGANGT